jgi:hypothetical protein
LLGEGILSHVLQASAPTSPIRIELINQPSWWESPIVGTLIGVIVGGALALLTEYARRRWDRKQKSKDAAGDARLARFTGDVQRARAELHAVQSTSGDLAVLTELASLNQLTPESAGRLTVSPDGITDSAVAEGLARLGARLRVAAGLEGAPQSQIDSVIATLTSEAARLGPLVEGELTARRSALVTLESEGQRQASIEASSMRK